MSPSSTRALVTATLVGTALQVAMVLAGHSIPAIARLFAVLGVTISLVAGLLFARQAPGITRGGGAGGGAIAGGVCALLGILLSFALGDVPAPVLAFGTLSSALTGALGGVIGQAMRRSAVAERA
jgi:hypothetical protein